MSIEAMAPIAKTDEVAARGEHLLLVRLLPLVKRPPSPGQVLKDLARFFGQAQSAEEWGRRIEAARGAGLLEPRTLTLTDLGRAKALEFLGLTELPARVNWAKIQAHYLLPKILGKSTSESARRDLQNEDRLAAFLLKERFGLTHAPARSLGGVLEALTCKELNCPQATSLKELKAAVIGKMMRATEPLKAKDLGKQAPRVLLGTRRSGIAGLRDVAMAGWADGAPPAEPRPDAEPAEFDLPAFANTVKRAANDCKTGRFGEDKVFVNHVWRRLRDEPSFAGMDLPRFKSRLIEANAAGLLTLSRADLVQLMDPADVQESEISYLNATFHFILLDKVQP